MAMADEEVVKVVPSPESAKTAGQPNVEMADGALDLKQDEKQLLDGSNSMNNGGFLKISGQSTLDNTRSIGTSNQSKPEEKLAEAKDIILEEKGEEDSRADLKEDEKLLLEEENSEEFITKEFILPLLGRVFTFIDEKKALESKRKTWNLKHQEEQVDKAKKQRTQWEYHNQDEASKLKTRFDAIFSQYESQLEQAYQCNSGEELLIVNSRQHSRREDEVFQVPVALAIQQSVIQVVKDQHRLVNKCLLHMMHRGLHLL